MAIDKEVLDQLLEGRDPKELFAKDGLLDELKKALSERILNAELDEHLDNDQAGDRINRRNGSSPKTVLTGTSKLTLDIPRDRAGSFEPALIGPSTSGAFPTSMTRSSRCMPEACRSREIGGHLEELYGLEVLADLISAVTDAVLEEVTEWQNRPLDAVHPIVFFDAIRVKIRDEGFVRSEPLRRHWFKPDGERGVYRARYFTQWYQGDFGPLD